jgi:uncharacterized protein (UPF0147 family)
MTHAASDLSDPLTILREIAADKEHPVAIRLKAASEAAQYLYAKKRELEVGERIYTKMEEE